MRRWLCAWLRAPWRRVMPPGMSASEAAAVLYERPRVVDEVGLASREPRDVPERGGRAWLGP